MFGMKTLMLLSTLLLVYSAFAKAAARYVEGDDGSWDILSNNDDTSLLRIKHAWKEIVLHPKSNLAEAGNAIGVNSRRRRHSGHEPRHGMSHGETGRLFLGRRSRYRSHRRDRHHGMRGRPHWSNLFQQPMGMRGDFGPYDNRNPGVSVSRNPSERQGQHVSGLGSETPHTDLLLSLQQRHTGLGPNRMGMSRMWHGRRRGHGGRHRMRNGNNHDGFGTGHHGRHHGRRRGGFHGRRGHRCCHHGQFGPNHHRQNEFGASETPEDEMPDGHTNLESQTHLLPNIRRKLNFMSTSQNKLNLKLHREIALPRSNIVYSPYGVFQSLSMLYLGSRRHTAFQMIRILDFTFMGHHVHLPIMHQNNLLENSTSSTFEMANAIFVPANITVNRFYSDMLASSFHANASQFDGNNLEEYVNELAASETDNLIPTILIADTLPQQPSSVTLMSAMYFKGKWKVPFQSDQTFEQMFDQSSARQVPVDMMTVEGMFRVGLLPGHDARLLELSYADDRFSMLIVLPDEVEGLPEVEESLTATDFGISLDTSIPTLMRVFLPKFKIETTLLLKEYLLRIGMTGAFVANSATLDGISQNPLHVNDIIHKAVVEVVEDGEDMSANIIPETVDSTTVPEFRCDHPFLFIIRDSISDVNLLVGKFSGESP